MTMLGEFQLWYDSWLMIRESELSSIPSLTQLQVIYVGLSRVAGDESYRTEWQASVQPQLLNTSGLRIASSSLRRRIEELISRMTSAGGASS